MAPPQEQQQHLELTFEPLGPKNLDALKLLNSVIFPIRYHDQLYKDCMVFEDITQLAYHGSTLVGAVVGRCELQPDGTAKLYIASLGVLAPYRGCGIGTQLLHRALAGVAEDPNVQEVYLHMQVGNDSAASFYSRFGFEVRETLERYYPRLDPPDAWLLAKKLTGS